jgi:hypothetical protein
MRKTLFGTMLSASLLLASIPSMARVDIGINIALPPLIQFSAPPEVVAIPETNVYVDPDIDVDIFFYSGWWWRPWQGQWYRSRDYRSGWACYRNTPSFYNDLPSGWRHAYTEHRYKGKEWNYQRIPHEQLQRNWREWDRNRYWEKQNSWGVNGLRSRTRSEQPAQSVKYRQSQPQYEKTTQKSKYRNMKSERGNKGKRED